jgi:hypothetical protein
MLKNLCLGVGNPEVDFAGTWKRGQPELSDFLYVLIRM